MKTQVTLATAEDAPLFTKWITNTPLNMFDPDIAKYPSLRTLRIDVDGKPTLYVPFHPVFMVESLAHAPDVSPRQNAYALAKFHYTIEDLARTYGIAETYWMCRDQSLIKFAERHGYELVTCSVLRKKVNEPTK